MAETIKLHRIKITIAGAVPFFVAEISKECEYLSFTEDEEQAYTYINHDRDCEDDAATAVQMFPFARISVEEGTRTISIADDFTQVQP